LGGKGKGNLGRTGKKTAREKRKKKKKKKEKKKIQMKDYQKDENFPNRNGQRHGARGLRSVGEKGAGHGSNNAGASRATRLK